MSEKFTLRDDSEFEIEKEVLNNKNRSYSILDKKSNLKFGMKILRTDEQNFSTMNIDVSVERGEIHKSFSKKVTQPKAQNPYSLECLMLSTLKMKCVGRDRNDESALNAKLTRQLLTLVGDEILEAPKHLKDIKLEKIGTTREEVKQNRTDGKRRKQEEAAQKAAQEAEKARLAPLKEAFNKDLMTIVYGSTERQ